ncbi:MAG: NAD(+)/NADH kinase, partial [Promethearchaeota archaeon]
AARSLPPGVPIFPVNLQSFGFLSECEIEDAETLLTRVLSGDFEVQEILRLSTSFQDNKIPDAANEVALFPQKHGRPLAFQLQIGEDSILQFRGDGLVIATPNGSTGHTLSLRGPVLHPNVGAILLVASAPLRNSMLPLVLPDSTILSVQANKITNLVIDGELLHRIPAEAPVTIKKSESPLLILRRHNSFFRRLREKLLRWP